MRTWTFFTYMGTLPVPVYRFRIILRCLPSSMTWTASRERKTAKSTNLKENSGKIMVVFVIRAALWAEKLGGCLEYCWSWKNTLENLKLQSTLEAIWFEFWITERNVSDGGNLCPLLLVILKSVWHGIGDTLWLQYSWPRAVVSYTFLAVVAWNELEHSRRKLK